MNAVFLFFIFATSALASQWDTYPQVPKTASVNGFSDPIKSKLPSCASECADFSTKNTPCPYWDTGCLCVMPQWSGQVAACIAKSCSGEDVASATSLAYSLCSSVGANVWMMPGSLSTSLSEAAKGAVVASATATSEGDSSATSADVSSATETGSASQDSAKSETESKSSTTSENSSSASETSSTSSQNGSLQRTTSSVFLFLVTFVSTLF